MNKKRKSTFLLPILFLSTLLFFAHFYFPKTALYSDSKFYFIYTRSLVKDYDLSLENELRSLNVTPLINSKGLAINTYPIGTSLFWVPLYMQVENASKVLNLFGLITKTTGFEFFYQLSAALGSIILGCLGLYILGKILKEYFPKKVVIITLSAVYFCTNLIFYISIEPLMSHSISFFTACLFLYIFLKKKESNNYYFLNGAIAAVSALVRTTNAFLIIIPIIYLVFNFFENKNFLKLLKNSLILCLGFFVFFIPQSVLWKVYFDKLILGPGFGYGFNFLNPKIGFVFFNNANGIFTLTPIILFSLISFILLFKNKNFSKEKLSLLTFLGYIFVQIYIISSWAEYHQGGSYSIRMLINTYPFLSFGTASFILLLIKNLTKKSAFKIIVLFSILNFYLIFRYLLIN